MKPATQAKIRNHLEDALREKGHELIAGVDEVGRGPLAGPVVAAAVVLAAGWPDPGVDDSKRLSAPKREALAEKIKQTAKAWALGLCQAEEVDALNIHRASLLAMRRAVSGLDVRPDYLLVDGRFTVEVDLPQQAVIKGDATCASVAAASILAKVHRDGLMQQWHREYPRYNFAANKGYGTAEHRQALQEHGPCPIHRKRFAPVAQMSLDLSGGGEKPAGLGRRAEVLAKEHLAGLGYEVVAANLRNAGGELDLVARDGEILVFVEVKARSRRDFGRPEEAVDARKQARLTRAAQAYLVGLEGPQPVCRFDVVALDFSRGEPRLSHLRDAFRP